MSIYQMLDQQISPDSSSAMLHLAASMVMICQSTRILRKCHQLTDYSRVSELKQVEDFLTKPKDFNDYHAYQSVKKKLSPSS